MSKLDFSTLPAEARIELWREAIAHLRYLNDEVWKRFQFFLWVNIVMIIVTATTLRPLTCLTTIVGMILALLGISLGFTARYILKRNRIYYLQMLLKKTLLENEAGFYDLKFTATTTDLALPWRLTPEIFDTLRNEPEKWTEQNIDAPKSIAQRLFQIYDVIIGIYGILFLIGAVILSRV